MSLRLIIGNKNYSSWSLRPWLLLRYYAIPFEEILIPLYQADSKEKILQFSAAGQVPILQEDTLTVWDSLAICEYIADRYPELQVWPEAPATKAWARSVSCEMHSGFPQIRRQLSMNCRKETIYSPISDDLEKEINRVCSIWQDGRERYAEDGDFLCGAFSIADAMYAPMVSRFHSYGIEIPDAARAYMRTIQMLPAYREWLLEGQTESERIGED